jgi:histidine triad (HIT) family protein
MVQKPCIFCQVVDGTIPSTKEYEDDQLIAFRDIYPKAPVHFLIIPKEHIVEFADITDLELWKKMGKVAQELIEKFNLRASGYRLVNNGAGAALIPHLHLHVLGGVEHEREI